MNSGEMTLGDIVTDNARLFPDRYDDFFALAHDILPADGVMLLHSMTSMTEQQMVDRYLPITVDLVEFFKFDDLTIFPGGFARPIRMVEEHSAKAGFTLTRRQSLQPHYARTLDLWTAALRHMKAGRSRFSPKRCTSAT